MALRLLYYEGGSLQKAPLKLTSAAHILWISPLLAGFCFAMPVQAALPSMPQFTTLSSAIQPSRSASFYQQQRDKLRYTPKSTLLAPDFSRLKPTDSPTPPNPSQSKQPDVDPVRPLLEVDAARDEQKQIGKNKQQNKKRSYSFRERLANKKNAPSKIVPSPSVEINQDSEKRGDSERNSLNRNVIETTDTVGKEISKKNPSIRERIQRQIQEQKQSRTKLRSQLTSTHRDPYDILKSAREKHSPLQGRHPDIASFNIDTLNVPSPDLEPLTQQLPEKISQIKTDLQSNIQQRPEQLKQVLVAAKDDLQQRSASKINGPWDRAKTFIQRTIKDPLSRLLKKVGVAAQATAEQLQ